MRINMTMRSNISSKTREAAAKIRKASEEAVRDVVVLIANDAIKGSPVAKIGGGNNRRSIKFESKGLTGSIFSTSGYGGFLETGTVKMAARPYFKPALDKNLPKLPRSIKAALR